ncbi:MAG: class I SAM-dependent methyltransferase [Xanthomonadales bacterium]|nr:class I SAM-dependent methyltransferase [Xanthomonadales bacterium]NNL94576.1 class I SAM-dependent methyltransferase [Xanthomonadales bacterium]
MINPLTNLARRLPLIRAELEELDALRARAEALQAECEELGRQCEKLGHECDRLNAECKRGSEELNEIKRQQGFVAPGHFYSPVPVFGAASEMAEAVFDSAGRTVPAIDLREDSQRALVETFIPYYQAMEFTGGKSPGVRYYYDNPAYSYSDAIMLHCMIRSVRPARIIEIGSGFSSCMMLDTNELHFDDQIKLAFVEPFPELLISLLEDTDLNNIRIVSSPLQDVALEEFKRLGANDILFIDSTHVSKAGSDVNRIFFDILPALAEGVYVHFHDVFFPFEYPPQWLREGRAWNEAYMLRAFLEYNSAFEVVLMNTFMHRHHQPFFEREMPLTLKNTGGSIWLRKTTDSLFTAEQSG